MCEKIGVFALPRVQDKLHGPASEARSLGRLDRAAEPPVRQLLWIDSSEPQAGVPVKESKTVRPVEKECPSSLALLQVWSLPWETFQFFARPAIRFPRLHGSPSQGSCAGAAPKAEAQSIGCSSLMGARLRRGTAIELTCNVDPGLIDPSHY